VKKGQIHRSVSKGDNSERQPKFEASIFIFLGNIKCADYHIEVKKHKGNEQDYRIQVCAHNVRNVVRNIVVDLLV
jgi:hypothetical protein